MTREAEAVRGHAESAEWEEQYFRTRRNRWLRRRRLRSFGFQPEERILEVGCGDGLNLELLGEAGCSRLLGTDISTNLLAHVRGTPVFAADLYRLPLPEAALDAELVDSVLHHLDPLPPALTELRRVLRPGGRLCVLEPRPTPVRRLFEGAMDRVPFPPPLRARQLAYFAERDVDRAWNAYYARFEGDLREAGFAVRVVGRLPVGIALECRRA